MVSVQYLLHDVNQELEAIGPASPTEIHNQAKAPFGECPRRVAVAGVAGNPRNLVNNTPAVHPVAAVAAAEFPDGIGIACI